MKEPKTSRPSTGERRHGGLIGAKDWFALFDHLSDGVLVSDSRLRLLYMNAAARRILRLDDRDRVGQWVCGMLTSSLPTERLGRCSGSCTLQDEPLKRSATVQLPGVRVRCLAAPSAFGGFHLTLLEDNRTEMELKRHQDDWRHMIVHDLRGPLTPILATLIELQDNAALAETDRSLVSISVRAARRMLDLLNLYLDVAKLEAGLMAVKLSKVELASLVRVAAAEQEALLRDKRQGFANEVGEALFVNGDAELLFRVVGNLINNAVKYTPEGGAIRVGAERLSSGVRLWVKDNGQGIPAAELPRLFDRFHQAQARRAGTTTGTGLGLAFCKQALEAMGGRIHVTSDLGRGSEFSVVLPEWPH